MKEIYKLLFIISLFFIFLPSVFGELSGEKYGVGSSTLSLQGVQASGSNYQARTYMNYGAGGDAQGLTYQANIGFFGTFRGLYPSYRVTINGSETVEAGKVYSVIIKIENLSNKNIEVSSVKINLYDPLKNLIASNVDAIKISDKIYMYNFTTSPTHIAGEWETFISLEINRITREYSNRWIILNSNTEVKINSINDNSFPAINADVTITNEGNIDYEYRYEYCIVSSPTEQCNEPSNVDYASGAKLIKKGESWNTVLSLNVIQQGTYWFKIIVYYGTGKSGASQSFIAEQAAPKSSGGSSGGGGIVTNNRTTHENKTSEETKQELISGEEIICNPPYIRYGRECCIDENDNKICDRDEKRGGVTGFLIGVGEKIKINFNLLLLLLIIISIYIVLRFRRQIFSLVRFSLIRKKKAGNKIGSLIGLKVYSEDGIEIGKIKDVIIENNKINSLKIRCKKKKFSKKGIILSYKHVKNIGEIALVDEKIKDEIENRLHT